MLDSGEELGFHYCTTEWSMASPFECAKDGQSIQGYAHLNAATRLTKLSSHGMFGTLIWEHVRQPSADLGSCHSRGLLKFDMDSELSKILERIAHVQCFEFVVVNFSYCGEMWRGNTRDASEEGIAGIPHPIFSIKIIRKII